MGKKAFLCESGDMEMSIKDKLTSFLLGNRAAKTADEPAQAEPEAAVEAVPEAPPEQTANPALLVLPSDHQLNRLYNLRWKESGSLPSPRLCLDEDGVFPADMIKREKNRLQTVLTGICGARLKEARGGGKKSGGKRKKQGEKAPEPEEVLPPCLDALPCFFVSSDKLYAWVIVFPPVGEGEEVSRDILRLGLAEQGITYGVDMRMVEHIPRDESRYFNLFLIAKGKPAFNGQNGNIIDNFPRVIERVLEVDEYDQVDYTALNLINNVEEGQEICHLIKPTEGEPGRTVLDEEIPARSGKSVPLPKGRNTEISEDGVQLLATIAGHVEFTGRSFQVKPVLDIPGDVDFSTGDLNFLGDINIQGDVISGFTVRAMGSVHVGGVVEAGSTVEAGGDLVVVKGILGDGTTTVQAHRSIFSKYIENSVICVRENLQTDCIVGSYVYCGGEVLVQSGRGIIMGGRISAAQKISARAVGSQSECKTAIALGGKPCANFEREATQQEVNELEMELEKLECQLDSPAKASLLSKTRVKLAAASFKLQQLEEGIDAHTKEVRSEEPGRLECDIAYPGTEISFGDEVLRLRQLSRKCIVKMIRGEIVVM